MSMAGEPQARRTMGSRRERWWILLAVPGIAVLLLAAWYERFHIPSGAMRRHAADAGSG
jgi:hypothetical protein